MHDIPYTTPEEDPFNIHPILLQPRRKRSSLLDKWIQEQQTPEKEFPNTPHNKAYLANLGALCVPSPSKEDIVTLDNYDIVDDDDIPATPDAHELPATPSTTRSKHTSKLLHNPASFCSFNPFRSASPALSSLPDGPGSSRSSKLSFLPRDSRHSVDVNVAKGTSTRHQHNRSHSLGTFSFSGSRSGNSDVGTNITSARSRPSVLGHFASASASQASVPSDTVYTPSRPSISSGDTYTSATPTTESDLPMTPSRINFMNSIRFRTKSSRGVFASASAIFSSGSLPLKKTGSSEGHNNNLAVAIDGEDTLPNTTITQRSQSIRIPFTQKPTSKLANSNLDSVGDENEDNDTYHTVKQPDPTRPHVAYSSGATLPRVSLAALSARHKKKKRLVVRGVGPNEVRKFEGVKQWCESFGEVSQIIRMPNGDLHVHFRLAEVADTVCRLRARVYITGVGSVQLSWLTGDKR